MIKLKNIVFIMAICLCASVQAKIQMPKIFSDNMVLQRDCKLNVWGKSLPNADIKIDFDGQVQQGKSDKNGDWLLTLSPMKANCEGKNFNVYENGNLDAKFSNVVVGEVWIASGQSNMQFAVSGLEKTAVEKIKSRAKNPLVREFTVNAYSGNPTVQWDLPQSSKIWRESDEKNVQSFSAIGFLFAEGIQKDLKVPVGIINTALGGSSMICWVPKESIGEYKGWATAYENFKKRLDEYDYQKAMKNWKEVLMPEWEKQNKLWNENKTGKRPKRPYEPTVNSPVRYYSSPTFLFNAKIAPISKLKFRGVIWYQGENDSSSNFDLKLSTMIKAWRNTFSYENMPFLIVQMPSFKSNWSKHCISQFKVFKEMKNVGLANAIDTGDEENIHPKDKFPIAARLVKIAMRDVYNKNSIHPYGPILKSVNYNADKAELSFDTDNRGLKGKGDVRGFEIKIDKNKWINADDVKIINDNTINIRSSDGKQILGVRYLNGKFPKPRVWLYNNDGEPAFLFSHEK